MTPKINATDRDLMDAIVKRASQWFPDRNPRDITLDLVVVHLKSCPLRLADMLAADDSNFIHDIVGIERHLNRRTFELEDCFLPRFADFREVTA